MPNTMVTLSDSTSDFDETINLPTMVTYDKLETVFNHRQSLGTTSHSKNSYPLRNHLIPNKAVVEVQKPRIHRLSC